MPTYLDRYLAGEHEQVWDELLALGAAVREQPLYDDALAVARETMRRARFNVETIVARLYNAGYIFRFPNSAFVSPEPIVREQIDALEAEVGTLPLSLRTWYELVGEVDISGTHSKWKVRGWDEYSTIALHTLPKLIATEPLQVYGISRQLDWSRSSFSTGRRVGYKNILFSEGKGMRSGFDSVEVDLMYIDEAMMDGIINTYPDAEFFVNYLRRSFHWGGFPGFANVDESLRPIEMLAQLTEGLLPILGDAMPTYLDRYLAGEYEQVWDELLALGAAVREQPLYDDALAVARETMRRARYNVETIVARLRECDYLFYQPNTAFVPSPIRVRLLVRNLEQKYGVIPISVRMWYEVVGTADLIGSHLDWKVRAFDGGDERRWEWEYIWSRLPQSRFWEKKHIETDPLQIVGVEKACCVEGMLYLGDDSAWKSGFSGAGVHIAVPDFGVDTLLIQHNPVPETFVGYLRRSFQWGGFPGFANVDESLRPIEMLAQLTEGLLPI